MAGGVFAKLNLGDRKEIVVLDAPASFEGELSHLDGVKIHRRATGNPVDFALVFVTKLVDVERYARAIATGASEDAVLWFAYPKGSSKRYHCEFNRDTGWQTLGDLGYEGVRQVAIDEDWSALRFRRAERVKSMKRDPKRAMSAVGKRRSSKP